MVTVRVFLGSANDIPQISTKIVKATMVSRSCRYAQRRAATRMAESTMLAPVTETPALVNKVTDQLVNIFVGAVFHSVSPLTSRA